MICQVFATYLPRFRNDSAMEKMRLRKPCKKWFRSWFTSRIWWSDLLSCELFSVCLKTCISLISQVISQGFATFLPRFWNVMAMPSCNTSALASQCTHRVFARHLPGVCYHVGKLVHHASRFRRWSATFLQRVCQGLEMYLTYHPAMHMSRFRNALTRSSQGICQELLTRKHWSRHSSWALVIGEKLQVICHIIAMCMPRFGNGFALTSCRVSAKASDSIHQVFARCLPLVLRSSLGRFCIKSATLLQCVCQGLEMTLPGKNEIARA